MIGKVIHISQAHRSGTYYVSFVANHVDSPKRVYYTAHRQCRNELTNQRKQNGLVNTGF